MLRRFVVALIAAISLVVFLMSPGYAATNNTQGGGLRVSPVRTDLTINPGQTQTTYVDIKNLTTTKVILQVFINDFTASGTSGNPVLNINNTNTYNPHSLKQFVAPINDITVNPGQTQTIPVVIKIPANNPGGGFYGAVRFAPASNTPNTKKTVALTASIASLILVRVPGPGIKENLSLTGFGVESNNQISRLFYTSTGLYVVSTFTNQGNVQEEPFGKISVTNDITGKVVQYLNINNVTPPGNVLPNSSRTFSLALNSLGSIGKYTVMGNFGYANNGQLLSAKTTIYVIAPIWIILLLAILIIIIALIWLTPNIFRAWYRRSIRKENSNKG